MIQFTKWLNGKAYTAIFVKGIKYESKNLTRYKSMLIKSQLSLDYVVIS